jgi:hypothetical protein
MRFALAVLLLGVTVAAAHAGSMPGWTGCRAYSAHDPQPIVRPASIMAACGDGNFYFTGLHWTSWTAQRAAAVGVAHANDCTPYCAAGHFHTYRAAVSLSLPQSCGAKREFTRLTWRFAHAHDGQNGSESFRCA